MLKNIHLTIVKKLTNAPIFNRIGLFFSQLDKLIADNSRRYYDVILCLSLMCGTGAVSVYLGQDFSFDLRNYHLYNAFSFINGRLLLDIDALLLHRYYSPIMDLPYYLLVRFLNDFPRLVAFIQGTYLGIMLFLVHKIFREIADPKTVTGFTICVLFFIAGTGAITIIELGTVFNDIQIGVLVITALYLYIKNVGPTQDISGRKIILPSLILGIAFGLKLTAGIYVVGAIMAMLIVTRINTRILLFMCLGLMLGFVISGGYWAYLMYDKFQNPIFPYYNNIFNSSWWTIEKSIDARFFPRDIYQWLFYPFYWIVKNGLVTEIEFSDPRVAGGMVSILIIMLYMVKRKYKKLLPIVAEKRILFLIAFFLFTYIAWISQFSIYRYALLLEILSVPILFLAVGLLIHSNRVRNIVFITILFIFILLTNYPNYYGRLHYAEKVYDISIPEIDSGSIIIADNQTIPQAWVFPFFDKSNRFFIMSDSTTKADKLHRLALSELNQHKGSVYLLVPPELPKEQVFPELFKCREIIESGTIETKPQGVSYTLYKLIRKGCP